MPGPRDVLRVAPLQPRGVGRRRHRGDEPPAVGRIWKQRLRRGRREGAVRSRRAVAPDGFEGASRRAERRRGGAQGRAPSQGEGRHVLPHRRAEVPLQEHALRAGRRRQCLLREARPQADAGAAARRRRGRLCRARLAGGRAGMASAPSPRPTLAADAAGCGRRRACDVLRGEPGRGRRHRRPASRRRTARWNSRCGATVSKRPERP